MTDLDKLELTPPDTQAAPDASGYVLIYTTFPSLASAEAVGGGLVDRGLAACVNILPSMIAIYRWQGERHRDEEVVMVVKTRAALVEAVVAETAAQHPYDNPAILAVPVVGGASAFLSWIGEHTRGPTDGS